LSLLIYPYSQFPLSIAPQIIAPDSSHWAKWIDARHAADPERRRRAVDMHGRLLDHGLIPLLTWHHIEELLGVADDRTAANRIACLQTLPMIAWIRLAGDEVGLGSITQVLAAELIAASEGCATLIDIRDRAGELLLHFGSGAEAIGSESWVWEVIRPVLRSRKRKSDLIAALSPLRVFDDRQTVGELSKRRRNEPAEMRAQLGKIYAAAAAQAMQATGGDESASKQMAQSFVEEVLECLPPPGARVRELLVSTLVAQGLDEEEIRDECPLAELNELALFRSHVRVVAAQTGRPFESLKRIPMDIVPSHVITKALREHGQQRARRSGSDLTDAYLGALAAYCDVLYVDKRTAEDFQRARRKEPTLRTLILARIAKGRDFTDLLPN
jgi:hypothetical protein